MKKIITMVLFLCLLFPMSGEAAVSFTAEDAFAVANESTSDPLVGIWKAYYYTIKDEATAHFAIITNKTGERSEWDYFAIFLDDTGVYKKGEIKMLLRQTETPGVLYAKTAEEVETMKYGAVGPVLFQNGVLDLARVLNTIGLPPVTLMVKAPDHKPSWYKEQKSSEAWNNFKEIMP